jgi:hypothetical protein
MSDDFPSAEACVMNLGPNGRRALRGRALAIGLKSTLGALLLTAAALLP